MIGMGAAQQNQPLKAHTRQARKRQASGLREGLLLSLAMILALSVSACGSPHAEGPAANGPAVEKVADAARIQIVDPTPRMTIKIGDQVNPHPVFAIYVMPGESRTVEPLFEPHPVHYQFDIGGGELSPVGIKEAAVDQQQRMWRWVAPEQPGHYTLRIERLPDGAKMRINAFVMHPATDVVDGRLNGFRIDAYPDRPLRGDSIYLPPKGFVEVNPQTRKLRVSPHFRLGEFVAKQPSDYPKYVALRENLILKLELIIQKLKDAGYPARSLHIMSGYRTPFYNRQIGNVPYSRHVWGGAADIFVDEQPRDGVMDDLNGDGRITVADAAVIYQLVDDLRNEPSYQPFVGGLGLYGPKPGVRGPFVHVDVRGSHARWKS